MREHFRLESKKTFVVVAVLFCIISVLLMVRIGIFETLAPINSGLNDDVRYLSAAKTLIETGKLTYWNAEKSTVFIMPGIVLLLAPFVAAFGEVGAVFAFKIFQILLQIFGIYLIGLIAQKVFNKKISKLAMIVTSVYFSWSIVINYIYTEVPFTVLLLLLIYLVLIALDCHCEGQRPEAIQRLSKKGLKSLDCHVGRQSRPPRNDVVYWAIAGVVWALSVLIRPTIALFPIIMLIMFLIRKLSWKQIGKISLVVSVVFVIIMSPWWIRNYTTFNRFIPLTLSNGGPMLEGSIVGFVQEPFHSEEYVLALQAEVFELGQDEIGRDRAKLQQAKENIRASFQEDFWGALKWHTIDKMAIQWFFPWISSDIHPTYINDNIKVFFFIPSEEHPLILFLGLVGMGIALASRTNRTSRIFLILIILYFNFVHLPYLPTSRYMFPVMPLIIIFACFGGVRWWDWIMLRKDNF